MVTRKDQLSHRERLKAILSGQKPDRFAASFWRHFFHKEHHAEGTAEAMLAFQRRFDWDFMKINPRADYHVEGWGLKQEWSHNEFRKHTKSHFPVRTDDDWLKIAPLPPTSPALAEHLRVVSLIRKGIGPDLPLLMTIFTPLAVAGRMVEQQSLLVQHLHTAADKVLSALRAITTTFMQYVAELRNAGADGIFFATTQWASADLLTWNQYQRFGVPFDLEVIRASGDDAINLFHVCSSNNFLSELAGLDYGCRLYNWDMSDPTNLPLDKADTILKDKVLVGGVDHRGWLLHSSPDEMPHFVDGIKRSNDPSRLIIGPGCSIAPEVPMDNLKAIREGL